MASVFLKVLGIPSAYFTAQFEAAWALTNIASTSETRAVVNDGAVPALVRNLHHHNPDLREQCAWCLGNIAGDSAVSNDAYCCTKPVLKFIYFVVLAVCAQLLHNQCCLVIPDCYTCLFNLLATRS